MKNAMLRAEGLSRTYTTPTETLTIFKGVSLAVERGESVAVTGASGVGKSTLLHILGGLDAPTAGRIEIDGTDLPALSPAQLARFRNRTIGFVFQFHHLLPEFTALENVQIPMFMNGVSRLESTRLALELLDRVGLSNRAGHRPSELSGGESQRVAIARALANRPPLLLADEPTGNLDERTGDAVRSLLAELHLEQGLTSIIVTHNPTLAAACDRMLHFEHGALSVVRR